jgi:hypothetical protein
MRAENWVKAGIGAGIGAVGGVLDTIGTEMDAKNIAKGIADSKPYPVYKQLGTYINYVVPTVEVILAGAGVVKGDMAITLATQAGMLAAAKVTRKLTMYPFGKKKNYTLTHSATPSNWTRDAAGRDASAYRNFKNNPFIQGAATKPAKLTEQYVSSNSVGEVSGTIFTTRGM